MLQLHRPQEWDALTGFLAPTALLICVLGSLMTLLPIFESPLRHPLHAKTLCPWALLQKEQSGGEVGIRREVRFASLGHDNYLGDIIEWFSELCGQVTSADSTSDSCPELKCHTRSDSVSLHMLQKPSTELSDSRRLSGEQSGRSRLG